MGDPRAVAFACAFGAVASLSAASATPFEPWRPPGLQGTATTLATVLDLIDRRTHDFSPAGERVEAWTLRAAGGATLHAHAFVRGPDVRIETVLDGATYASGRAAGVRWRSTPSGLVRIVEADVQGDDLDRWPFAPFGFSRGDATAVFETTGPGTRYVVELRAAHDLARWLYVDETSGDVVREVAREGARAIDVTYSDLRATEERYRPYAWHVEGDGEPVDVTVDAVAPADVPAQRVALPRSSAPEPAFAGPTAVLPSRFGSGDRVYVSARVDGRSALFQLDSGTSQILVTDAAAKRLGLHPVLGHAVVSRLETGPAVRRGVAVQTTPYVGQGVDGILGYDFFAGTVVRLDYPGRIVALERRDTFVPPAGASRIDVSFAEGMPIVAGLVGSVPTARVLLDTGSPGVVLLRALVARPDGVAGLGLFDAGGRRELTFLEGSIAAQPVTLRSLQIGDLRLTSVAALEQVADEHRVDFPLDAIVGTNVLANDAWWFDADGGHAWSCRACAPSPEP